MKLNALDKAIGWISPATALRRARQRAALTVFDAYEGAKTGRRTAGWNTSGASANSELSAALPYLRDRSRDLLRNNPLVKNARGKWKDSVVGPGILCQWQDESLQAKWDAWTKVASADNLAHFEAVQLLACSAEFESGEAFLRIRPRRKSDGVWPPFVIQVLESDYLDLSKSMPLDTGYVLHGKEFDSIGRVVAYWMFDQHPGDVGAVSYRGTVGQSKRIPADQISHVFEPDRPGQVRGVPRTSAVLLASRDTADWEEAEIVRKRTEACIAAAVSSPEDDSFTFTTEVQDVNGNPVSSFEPGMIVKLKPGEDVSWNSPSYAGGYDDYKTSRQRDAAAGMQIPFELVTGNYSKSNYSSSRMGAVAFERTVTAFQWNVIVPLVCEFAAQAFLRLITVLEGSPANTAREWNPPPFNLLDRLNEAKADQVELQVGKTSWPQLVARAGNDPRKHLAAVQEYTEGLKQAGIDFFGGQLAIAEAGQQQKQENP